MTKERWYSAEMVFPWTDQYGYVWMDQSAWYEEKAEPCFVCKTPTHRLDIDYQGYYCASPECEKEIWDDLARTDGLVRSTDDEVEDE